MAPAQLPVEIRWIRGDQRVFRLSTAIDPETIEFAHDLPFPAGEPARVRFTLPADGQPISATAELSPRGARFSAIDGADRQRIVRYVRQRLGLS